MGRKAPTTSIPGGWIVWLLALMALAWPLQPVAASEEDDEGRASRYARPPLKLTVSLSLMPNGCRFDVLLESRTPTALASVEVDGMWRDDEGNPVVPFQALFTRVGGQSSDRLVQVQAPAPGCHRFRELDVQALTCRRPAQPFSDCGIDLSKRGRAKEFDLELRGPGLSREP